MSREKLFGSLCGLVFLVNFARVVFAPLVSEFIAEFAIQEGTAGLIVTLVWVGSASPRLPTGWLLTKVPRHHVVFGSGAILTVASASIALADSVPTVMIGAFSMGLASGIYFVAANPFISELFPDRVGRVMGIHGTASQLAAVVAAPVVTLAVVYDWRAVFVGLGTAAALTTVVIFLLALRTDLPEAGREDTSFLAGARREWRIILTGVLILGLTGFAWQGLFNFYELYMRSKGIAPSTARNLLTVIFAAGVPAFWVSGQLADRFPHVPYIITLMGSFAALVLTLTVTNGLAAVVLVSTLIGFVIHAMFPALDTFLLDSIPDESRGSAYAVYSGMMMLTQSSGSFAVGKFVEVGVAYDTVFTSFAVGVAVLTVGFAVLERANRLPA